MASYTGNLGLKKPALDDDALITDINNNMDILDAAVNGIQDGLAIVANGNTHVAITSGQFVYVRNHGTLTEGLYVASSNIAANATLSTSNLTADSAGGLNALNSKITNVVTPTYRLENGVTLTPNTQGMNIARVGKILSFKLYFRTGASGVATYQQIFSITSGEVFATGAIHEIVNGTHDYVGNGYSDKDQSALNTYTPLNANTDYIVRGIMLLK